MLNAATSGELAGLLLKSFTNTLGCDVADFSKNLLSKLSYKSYRVSEKASLSKYKNYCLLSGRGRTYNRSLYIARHNMRKLVGLGLISGLTK